MDIMERKRHITDIGCVTPEVRKEKVLQSIGEVVRWGSFRGALGSMEDPRCGVRVLGVDEGEPSGFMCFAQRVEF